MESTTVPSDRRVTPSKRVGLLVGIAALFIGQAWISAAHWLQLPSETFSSFSGISCSIVPICQSRYPPYFGFVLLLLLLALGLLTAALREAALRVTRDVAWSIPTPFMHRKGWRWGFLLFATLALAATIWNVYTAVMADNRYPPTLLWFATIVLWGIAFYSLDRAGDRPSGLTRGAMFRLICYVVLLLVLGYVYHIPVLQTIVPRAGFVITAGVIILGLWRLRRISGLTAVWGLIAVVGMAAYTYELDSWRYAFVGDEFAFFNITRNFWNDPGAINLVSSRGVYESHPVFATFVTSISMVLYGGDIYSWRVSGVLMVFASAPAIFVLVRQLTGSTAGVLAVIFYVSAHHLLGFSHPGYFAMQVLLGFTAMLAFAVLACQQHSILTMFLAGIAAAYTFFSYTLAIPLIPVPLLLLGIWILYPTRDLTLRNRLIRILPLVVACVIGSLVTALPRMTNTIWLRDAASNTILSHSELPNLTNPLLQQVFPNVLYTLTASLYFDHNSHYISGAHLDPVSSAFMLVGVAGLLAVAKQRRVALWLLISFLAAVVVVGASVPYPYPSHARTFLLVVFYAIFAALGAAYLWEKLGESAFQRFALSRRRAVALMVVVVVSLNAYQFFYLYSSVTQSNRVSMLVREFQESPPETTFYFAAPLPDDQNLLMVLRNFGFDTERLIPVTSSWPLAALTDIRRDGVPPYSILIAQELPDVLEWLDDAQLIWVEYTMRNIEDDSGVTHFIAIDVPD